MSPSFTRMISLSSSTRRRCVDPSLPSISITSRSVDPSLPFLLKPAQKRALSMPITSTGFAPLLSSLVSGAIASVSSRKNRTIVWTSVEWKFNNFWFDRKFLVSVIALSSSCVYWPSAALSAYPASICGRKIASRSPAKEKDRPHSMVCYVSHAKLYAVISWVIVANSWI